MDNSVAKWDQHSLIEEELLQGRELANQLQAYLNVPINSSNYKAREFLVQKIINSYDKVLSMLKWHGSSSSVPMEVPQEGRVLVESPHSTFSGSPKSDDSFDKEQNCSNTGSKKRKSMIRWTKQVQVCPGTGLEGPLDDGFNWRKYGQKDILGAKYPRGYYRCTHRNLQGCLATKQVQRTDEDPTIFEVTYRGNHTCTLQTTPQQITQNQSLSSPPKQQPNMALVNQFPQIPSNQTSQFQSQEVLINFQTNLKVDTENLEITSSNPQNQAFYFPAPSVDNNIMGNNSKFSPFVSPNNSGSNYFSTHFGGNQNLNTSDQSDLTDIVSAATSATNSPTVGLDFPFGGIDQFELPFSFDNTGFFS